jgi:hypothetical protein
MLRQAFRVTLMIGCSLLGTLATNAQSRNLLKNPNADLNTQGWLTYGRATVEASTGNNLVFVVRNGGYFIQDVPMKPEATGQWALLIARASCERSNRDGSISGLPYLYGYMMDAGEPRGGNVFAYLQGQKMGSERQQNEWAELWGVFQVPQGTGRIRFFLKQALAKGTPQNDSAARFDNVGLYLFATKEEAQAFAKSYH